MEWIMDIGNFIPLLPLAFGVWKWNALLTKHRVFVWFLVGISVLSLLNFVWKYADWGNNLLLFRLYILYEVCGLLWVFSQGLLPDLPRRRFVIVGLLFFLLWFVDAAFLSGWWSFPDLIHALEALTIIGMVAAYFLKLLQGRKIFYPTRTYAFWVAVGSLQFFSGNLLLFLFSERIVGYSHPVFLKLWGVHALLSNLMYLCYTVALYQATRKTDPPHPFVSTPSPD